MPPLIDYSSSESEPEEDRAISSNGKRSAPPSTSDQPATLPPLPTTFHALYPVNPRSSTTDDPSLHSGRSRQIPHTEGTWPSHIQLEWHPDHETLTLLNKLLSKVRDSHNGGDISSLLVSALGAPLPLHISLSRTLPLQTDQRAGFLNDLKESIGKTGAKPFKVKLDGGIEWASNEDGSRVFLVLKPGAAEESGREELGRLLEACNEVVIRHGLAKTLYADRRADIGAAFHVSIAWCLGLRDFELRTMQVQETRPGKRRKVKFEPERIGDSEILETVWRSAVGKAVSEVGVSFDRVLARVGNAIHIIRLGEPISQVDFG